MNYAKTNLREIEDSAAKRGVGATQGGTLSTHGASVSSRPG